jgi:hypothetical protein
VSGIRFIIVFRLGMLGNTLKLTILPHEAGLESEVRPEIVAVGDTPIAIAPSASAPPFLIQIHALSP